MNYQEMVIGIFTVALIIVGSGPAVTLLSQAQAQGSLYDCSWQSTQLSTQDWELLFHRAYLSENLSKDFLLFKEGAKLGCIWKIKSGSVAYVSYCPSFINNRIDKDGTTINTLGEGEIFGMSSIYGGTTTTAARIAQGRTLCDQTAINALDNTSLYIAKLGDIEKILTCSPGLSYRFNYYAANCMFSTLQFVAVCALNPSPHPIRKNQNLSRQTKLRSSIKTNRKTPKITKRKREKKA